MLPVTLNGEDIYLLHYRADWVEGFLLRVAMRSLVDRSQGGIEARTPIGDTLRATLGEELQLYEGESSEFRVALQRLANKRVLCPVWPAAHRYLTGASVYLAPDGSAYLDEEGNPYYSPGGVTTPYISSGLWLLFEEDWSAWAVLLGDEEPGFTPSATAVRVPLILGRFEERPRPGAETDRLVTCSIAFVEQSPAAYALVPMTLAPAFGPSIGSREIPVFPIDFDWSSPPDAGEVMVECTEEETGHGREPTSIYYPQDSARIISGTFTPYQWDELALLLNFFLQRKGQAGAFWIEHPLKECELILSASADDTVLFVNDASLLGDNRYISIPTPNGSIYAHIASVDLDDDSLTLSDPIGAALEIDQPINSLVLARFAKPELELHFLTDALAETRIDFLELGSEYYTPTGETFDETFAALPTIAYLYRFTRFYPGQTIYNRYTSHERDLLLDGETFLAKGFEHGSIKDTIEPEDVSAEIRAPAFPGNPLLLFSPNRLEVPLYCEIIECQVGPDGAVLFPVSRIYGKVGKPRPVGAMLSATIGSLLGEVSQEVPTLNMQRGCNVALFSSYCKLLEDDWKFTGTIDSIVGNVITLSALSRTNGAGLPTIDDHWFAAGRLWTGTGEAYETRTIFDSAVGSGTVVLTLSDPLNLTPGAPLYFTPGCGGSYDECVIKYNNRENFRGFPWMPFANPTLLAIQDNTKTDSKK